LKEVRLGNFAHPFIPVSILDLLKMHLNPGIIKNMKEELDNWIAFMQFQTKMEQSAHL